MAKRKTTNDGPVLANQKQLPNDRESLGLLLRTCERVIEYVNEVSCREKLRLKACTAAARQNGSSPLIDAWKHGIAAGARDQLAKPLPLIDVIAPYISSQYAARIAELQNMDLPYFDWNNPQSISAIGAVLKHERLVTIFQELLACIQQLQGEVATKLEIGCDSVCDTSRRSYKKLPDDPVVLRAAMAIDADKNQGRTQIEVAEEFTDGDRTYAKSVVRQAKRYGLIKPRRRTCDNPCDNARA